MPTLDLPGYLKAEGYSLVGPGDKEGDVRVVAPDGTTGTLNVPGLLKSEGMAGVKVEYNRPDSPLDTSPVGFLDRVALGLGNAKGQLQYLKHNYGGATLTPEGDLLVKDKGFWHRVDARGLGDGNGWDMAKELAGDAADIVKDIAVGAGSVAGASVGGGLGALAGGAGAIPGTLAGSGIGAGIGSGAAAALGRIVGTYDATPEEVMSDVGMDALLGLAGEGVALGAKTVVVPKLAKMLSTMADSSTSPGVRNMVARAMNLLSGGQLPQDSAERAVTNHAVGEYVEQFTKKALEKGPAAVPTSATPSILGQTPASSSIRGSEEAVMRAARDSMIPDAAFLTQGAQARASAIYRQGIEEVAAMVPEGAAINANAPLAEGIQAVLTDFPEIASVRYGSDGSFLGYGVKSVPEVAKQLQILPHQARTVKKAMQTWMDHSHNIISGKVEQTGPAGMRQVFENYRHMNEFYSEMLDSVPSAQNVLGSILGGVKDKLSLVAGNGPVQNAIAQVNQDYYLNKQAVNLAKKATDGGRAGIESLVNRLSNPIDRDTTTRGLVERLGMLAGDEGAAAVDSLLNKVAATDFIRTSVPKGALGYVPRLGGRMALKGANLTTRGLSMLGSTFRGMDTRTRQLLLKDERALGALLGTAIGEGFDPTQAAAAAAEMSNR